MTKTSKQTQDQIDDLDAIDDRFDRVIAIANLLSISYGHFGEELADGTVPVAAFALYQDLCALKADVSKIVDSVVGSKSHGIRRVGGEVPAQLRNRREFGVRAFVAGPGSHYNRLREQKASAEKNPEPQA
jgi:hypothetical protein